MGYVLLMTFGGCADRMILQPPGGAIDAIGAERRTIKSGGGDVEVWVAKAPNGDEARMFVLEFTGNATRAEQIAEYVGYRYQDYGAEAWVMNYPGYGGSEGSAKLKSIGPAALAVFDELKRRAGDRPILVAGNSLGTAAALYVAANREVAGLVLQNPPPLRQLILGRYGWWNLWLAAGPIAMQIPGELNSIANASHVHCPAVFCTADEDGLVPPKYHRMVIDAYAGPKRVIRLSGAGHNSSVEGEAERQLQEGIGWIVEGVDRGDAQDSRKGGEINPKSETRNPNQ